VHLYHEPTQTVFDNIVRNSMVHDNARVGNRGVGIGIYAGARTAAYDNLVWGNKIGIVLDYVVDATGVYNNTVYGNVNEGIYVGGSTNATIENNIVYKNGSSISDNGTGTTKTTDLVDVDPLFVGEATHDFRLTETSPAIDKGTAVTVVTSDYAGVARPQGPAYDIGAFEWAPPGADGGPSDGGVIEAGPKPANDGAVGTDTGGPTGSGGGSPADGGAPAAAPDAELDSGCACSTAKSRGPWGSWMLLVAIGLAAAVRRNVRRFAVASCALISVQCGGSVETVAGGGGAPGVGGTTAGAGGTTATGGGPNGGSGGFAPVDAGRAGSAGAVADGAAGAWDTGADVPAGTSVTGRACTTPAQCGSGYDCYTLAPGGYCMPGSPGGPAACRDPEAPCSAGTVCSPLPWHAISGVCLQPCATVGDCRGGYACNYVELFPGDPGTPKSPERVCWTVCEIGMDQTCNDNPVISSTRGTCQADGTCKCNSGVAKNPDSGRCL
jgi:MYXO-CTERM domain-containing protein